MVWLESAAAHLGNPYYFLSSIYKYEMVGAATGQLIAILLPALQFTIALCLICRVQVGGALLASGALLTLFTVVQTIALARGIEINCGCFGPGHTRPIGYFSVAIVSCLAIMAFSAFACCLMIDKPCRGQDPARHSAISSLESVGNNPCAALESP
jgi:hypothetical protein